MGSAPLRLRCAIVCSSRFVDAVPLPLYGPYGSAEVFGQLPVWHLMRHDPFHLPRLPPLQMSWGEGRGEVGQVANVEHRQESEEGIEWHPGRPDTAGEPVPGRLHLGWIAES